MIASLTLKPIIFIDLYPEGKPCEDFDDKFKEKVEELGKLCGSTANSNFKAIYDLTLKNFSVISLHKKEYEDQIFQLFKNQQELEFQWRQACLLGSYKRLKTYYHTNEANPNILDLAGHIIERQKALVAMEGTSKHLISWKKIYNKTFKYLSVHEPCQELLEKILNIWKPNDQTDSLSTLRPQFLELLKNKSKPNFDLLVDKFIANLHLMKLDSKAKIKDLYGLLSAIPLTQDQELALFTALEKISNEAPAETRVRYQRFKFFHLYKKLKLSEGKTEDRILLDTFKTTLLSLGNSYSSEELKKEMWDQIFANVAALPLSDRTKKELLEIFLKFKKPGISSVMYVVGLFKTAISAPSTVLSSLYKTAVVDGEAAWKGDKYLQFLQSTQQWWRQENSWIALQLEDPFNDTKLKDKVMEIFSFLENLEFPELSENADIKERKVYNETLRTMNSTYINLLRTALSTEECISGLRRVTISQENRATGCVRILMRLCHNRFAGTDVIPFICKLMQEMIVIGLNELIQNDTSYQIFLNPSLYQNPLNIPIPIAHEAIEKIPSEHLSPLISIIGSKIFNVANVWDPHLSSLPMNLVKLIFKSEVSQTRDQNGQERTVVWLRFPTPTSGKEIIPEYKTFMVENHLFVCSTQSSADQPEDKRTRAIFEETNKTNTSHAIVAPMYNSGLFEQTGDFADVKDQPRFSMSVSFHQAIMQYIIPDPVSGRMFNQPGNYLIPDCWQSCNDFKQRIDNCLRETNYIFFNNEQKLPEKDRRAFIKFFNIVWVFSILKYADHVKYFAFICNHSADRTGVFCTLLLKMLMIMFDKENEPIDPSDKNSPTWSQVLLALIDGVPILMAKREMNDFYIGMMEALAILDNPKVRNKLREARERVFGLVNFEYPFAKPTNSNSNNNSNSNSN